MQNILKNVLSKLKENKIFANSEEQSFAHEEMCWACVDLGRG